jgi:hypothetical protein
MLLDLPENEVGIGCFVDDLRLFFGKVHGNHRVLDIGVGLLLK